MSDETLPVKESSEKRSRTKTKSTSPRRTKKASAKEKIVIDSSSSFYSDIRPRNPTEDLFYARIIPSPYEKGIIEAIELPELPQDYFFLTADKLPFAKSIKTLSTDIPLLAQDHISYKGEPVAVIAGTDKKRLEQLASTVEIRLKPEEEPKAISEENSPEGEETSQEEKQEDTGKKDEKSGNEEGILVDIKELINSFEDNIKSSVFNENIEKRLEQDGKGKKEEPETVQAQTIQKQDLAPDQENERIISKRSFSYGDYEKNYEDADFQIENTFKPKLHFSTVSEPEGAYIEYADGNFSVYAPTLWAGHLRKNVAAVLNMQEESIHIKKTIISNADANSLWYNTIFACLAAVVSLVTEKSVLLISPQEITDLINTPVDVTISHKTGVRKDGRITSAAIDITVKAGAYCPFSQLITDSMAVAASGAYRPEAMSVCVKVKESHSFPAISGTRNIDKLAFFAIESQLQDISRVSGILPIELRSINCMDPSDKNDAFPIILDRNKITEVCEKVQELSTFNRKYTSYSQNPFTLKSSLSTFPSRGMGMAAAFDGKGYYGSSMGFMKHTLEATMEKDSSLTVKTQSPAPSIIPVWKSYASKLLGISSDQVHFEDDEGGGELSELPETITGSVYIMTQLLKKCCQGIQKLRFRQPLPITVKKKLTKQKTQSWNQENFSGTPYYSVSWGAAAAEIEIDPLLYKPKIRGIWLAINAGSILNKKQTEISIRKDVNDILRNMMEGTSLSPDKLSISFIESQEEPKQLGCIVHSILPAAIGNAIAHALKKVVTTAPLPLDYIFREVLS